jgi:hypothetical protein
MRPLVFIACLLVISRLAHTVEAERTLRIYDVVDLLEIPRDLPAPILGIAASVVPDAASASIPRSNVPIAPEAFLRATFESGLATLIAENSEWRSGHLLALNATEILHRQVERTLISAREQARLQVRVNLKLVLMDPHVRVARFPLVRLAWKPLPDHAGQLYAELAPADLEYVTANLRLNTRPSKELDTTHYPLLSLAPGQLGHVAHVTTLVHKPMSLLQGGSTAALPLGDTISVRATPTPDRNYLTIEVHHQRCTLIEKRTMDFGTSGTAELPVLWQVGERIRRSIPVGHGLIIATSAYLEANQPRCGFLIIRPELRSGVDGTPQVTITSP